MPESGVVVKSTGSWYEVLKDNGERVSCRLRGQFRIQGIKTTNPVVVGDRVQFIYGKDDTGSIVSIEERKNYIYRKATNLSKITQLIAVNIDTAFLVITLKEPRTSLGFIDRFLVSAEAFRIPVCLVFNKIDLYNEKERETVDFLEKLYREIGYDSIAISAETGFNIDLLKEKMRGKVSLFSGHSGVGKSAIINAIDPSLHLKIGKISSYHNKGKHTTTFAEMFPVSGGGFIMDTPGIKEFGLIQYSKEEIRDYFPEIRAYNNRCKFNNCTHVHEPGCLVIKAVEEGKIPSSRYSNYLAILQDNDLKIADWELR